METEVHLLVTLSREEFARMMGDPNLINPTIKSIWLCLEEAGYQIVKKGAAVMVGSAIQYNVMDSRGDVYNEGSIKNFHQGGQVKGSGNLYFVEKENIEIKRRYCDINNQQCIASGRCTGEC